MIKVIEHGTLKEKCSNCKAKLEFSIEDIIAERRPDGKKYIICPDCGAEVPIKYYNNKKPVENSSEDIDFDILQ